MFVTKSGLPEVLLGWLKLYTIWNVCISDDGVVQGVALVHGCLHDGPVTWACINRVQPALGLYDGHRKVGS